MPDHPIDQCPARTTCVGGSCRPCNISITETCIVDNQTIVIPATPSRADVLLVFDTTGSMASVLSSVQSGVDTILTTLRTLVPDVQFGVVDFRDYPISPFGEVRDWPHKLRQPITANETAIRAALNALAANGGADLPEAYTRALYETYSDPAIGWREGARRFVIMFGDSV